MFTAKLFLAGRNRLRLLRGEPLTKVSPFFVLLLLLLRVHAEALPRMSESSYVFHGKSLTRSNLFLFLLLHFHSESLPYRSE